MTKQNQYTCGKCSKDFETLGIPPAVGPQDLFEYKDGTPVADILIYVCKDCYKEIRTK